MTTAPVEIFCCDLTAGDDASAITEMVNRLAPSAVVHDLPAFASAVWQRETQQRTWLGHGTALPHARLPSVERLALVLARHPSGIPWGTPDHLARLIFLVAVPVNAGATYLALTQRITRTLRDPGRRRALLRANTESDLAAAWQPGA